MKTAFSCPLDAHPATHSNDSESTSTRCVAQFALALLAGLSIGTSALAADSPTSKRLKRSEAFLGIHFDFHAGDDCKEIGRNTTPAMIENILNQVHPDYLQVDCKGHPGYSSYPTRVGHPAPGFVGDPLRVWRDVTAAHGVSLYLHYSGVWDSQAVEHHPEWAVVGADGKRSRDITSVFSPYVDQLLLPQLRELAGSYGADGAWVDGECWATLPDYGEAAVKAFRAQTGRENVPRQASDPGWNEWLDFHREAFRSYLRHYVDEMKRTHPDFEVCSNWAFSDHMPEPVSANLAFLSGDFSPQNSLNSARFSARCLAPQGRPWDLMAWSFSGGQSTPARPLKSALQLQQEAAVVLAQGGGFQAYFRQLRDGSIYDWEMATMAEVAKFCRERQAVAHRQEIVPQVALLYSRAAHYRSTSKLFAPWGSTGIQGMRGVLQGLLEAQWPIEVLSEHHLSGRMARWPLIVIPEWDYLDPSFRDELLAYVTAGGRLLLIGPKSTALFRDQLGVETQGEPTKRVRHLGHRGSLGGIQTIMQAVKPGPGVQVFGSLHQGNDPRSTAEPAATLSAVGKGFIGAVHFNFTDPYLHTRVPVYRDFLSDLVRELFPNPIVTVTGSHAVDVSLGRNHGRTLVNLVNTAGPHEQEKQFVFDDLPAVGPLKVELRSARPPQSVVKQPGNTSLPFRWQDGRTLITVPPVAVYDVVVVEE